MTDYIPRESVKKMFGTRYGGFQLELDTIPAADVVEVVRCGKCKYKRDTLYCRLRETPVIVSNADFCSFGKPKE